MTMTIAESLIAEGEEKGLKKGLAQGALKLARATLLKQLLARYPQLPRDIETIIRRTKDIEQLEAWLLRFATAQSLEDVGIEVSGRK